MIEPTEQVFLADVKSHEMAVVLNHGVHRHLRFRRPKNSIHWFDLITWPGCLCIQGDMGCFVFSRVEDMFKFFRHEPQHEALKINPGYWAEKLQDGRDRAKRFSIEALKRQCLDHVNDNYDAEDLSIAKRNAVYLALDEQVFERFGDSEEYVALEALFDFREHGVRFDPCDGPWGKEWSYHFVWCLYAIVWGIAKYDLAGIEETRG